VEKICCFNNFLQPGKASPANVDAKADGHEMLRVQKCLFTYQQVSTKFISFQQHDCGNKKCIENISFKEKK